MSWVKVNLNKKLCVLLERLQLERPAVEDRAFKQQFNVSRQDGARRLIAPNRRLCPFLAM